MSEILPLDPNSFSKIIKVSIKNEIATLVDITDYIVCKNSKYGILFEFDDAWKDSKYKTVRFIYDDRVKDVVIAGNLCAIPPISHSSILKVGVFAGDLTTSTSAVIPCKKSILCEEGDPTPPGDEDIYEKILSIAESAEKKVDESKKALDTAIQEAQKSALDASNSVAEILKIRDEVISASKNIKTVGVSNAIKSQKSGEIISMKDTSPIEHEMSVKVRSKNILDLSSIADCYVERNGATMICGDDGCITLEGIPSGAISLPYFYIDIDETKVYTLSAHGDFTNVSLAIIYMRDDEFIRNSSGTVVGTSVSQSTKTKSFSLTNYPGANRARCEIKRSSNNVEMKGKVYFQLEEGNAVTPYTPCITDMSSIQLIRSRKNILEPGYYQYMNGSSVEFYESSEDCFRVYGEVPEDIEPYELHFASYSTRYDDIVVNLPRGIYTLSGCPKGGAKGKYYLLLRSNGEEFYDYGSGVTFELQGTQEIFLAFVVEPGVSLDVIVKPMIEVGTGDKIHEPRRHPRTYQVNSDGRVEGVTSLYPTTTTLTTDTPGVVVDCTYELDINEVARQLYYAILSLGGNV